MWWKSTLIVLGSIVILIIASVTVDNMGFKKRVNSEIAELFSMVTEKGTRVITEEDIKGLPEPLQRYFRYTGVLGKENIIAVRLKQRGFFRQGYRPWMPFEAEQYYTTDPPGFIWAVRMKALPFFSIKGRDMYYEGKGNMLIKLPPFIKIADARGDEINQGTLLRFLNEMMWFPTAYLSEYIQWEAIDSTSARATMSYGGVTASAIIYFNEKGEMTDFVARRYMSVDGGYSLETWSTPIKEYREINGIRLPVKGEGVWKLSSGDFTYISLEVTDIEYNNPSPY
jgi:hypothetical protein